MTPVQSKTCKTKNYNQFKHILNLTYFSSQHWKETCRRQKTHKTIHLTHNRLCSYISKRLKIPRFYSRNNCKLFHISVSTSVYVSKLIPELKNTRRRKQRKKNSPLAYTCENYAAAVDAFAAESVAVDVMEDEDLVQLIIN